MVTGVFLVIITLDDMASSYDTVIAVFIAIQERKNEMKSKNMKTE